MKRIDLWRKKLELDYRLIVNTKEGWYRIVGMLGNQWRLESTSNNIDLFFNKSEDALQEMNKIITTLH